MKTPLFYEMKKGNPASLKGLLIVYCRVIQVETPDNRKSPIYEMAKSGILAASGDYRTQNTLNDFLKKELGLTLDDLSKPENANLSGLPEGMDPGYLRKKIESMKGFEEMIPTPAKLEHFGSEEEVLSRDTDIFYLGEFERLANANLAVNALSILYQAIYREQAARFISQEIEKMLLTTERDVNQEHYTIEPDKVEARLHREFLPELIYNRDNPEELKRWTDRLKNYLSGYKYPEEIEKIIMLSTNKNLKIQEVQGVIELYIRKIAALLKEDYKTVGALKKEIERIEAGNTV
ncbi:MAG: hypothetical protein V1913_01670 [Fibrobacterota bacterium]